MKITDLRCAVIGKHPIVRIVTDEGLHGLGEVEYTKPYLKPWVLHFREALIGEDPTDVERVMLKIRQRGSFKPYGAAVSAIEHALWDIAGKAAGVPVYKLLGGKVRDKVRVYNGSIRKKRTGDKPEDYAADVKWMMERPENFFMVKQGISFHSNMKTSVPGFHYGVASRSDYHGAMDQGMISERGMAHMIDCVIAMKEVLGDKVEPRARLRPGLDAARRHPLRAGGGEVQSHVAGGHADRRLRAMGQSAGLPRAHDVHLHAHPHGRADLSAPQLQGADRDAGGPHHRAGPGRYRRHRRAQMGGRARPHALDPDGAARHGERPARPRRADQCLRHPARQLHRLRISRAPPTPGGRTSSSACPSRS